MTVVSQLVLKIPSGSPHKWMLQISGMTFFLNFRKPVKIMILFLIYGMQKRRLRKNDDIQEIKIYFLGFNLNFFYFTWLLVISDKKVKVVKVPIFYVYVYSFQNKLLILHFVLCGSNKFIYLYSSSRNLAIVFNCMFEVPIYKI